MRRIIRALLRGLLIFAAALLAASVGVVFPNTFRVSGPGGQSATAWAAYEYEGTRFNFVDALSWTRAGKIAKSDGNGEIRLPLLIYVKAPLDGWLSHEVRLIHAPELHATAHERRPADNAVLTIADNSDDPEAWARSLEEVYSLVAYDIAFAERSRYDITPDAAKDLARMVVEDYRALLAAHGDRPRGMPSEMPGHLQFASEEERAEWRERMQEEMEREPTWGTYLERRYAARVAELRKRYGL